MIVYHCLLHCCYFYACMLGKYFPFHLFLKIYCMFKEKIWMREGRATYMECYSDLYFKAITKYVFYCLFVRFFFLVILNAYLILSFTCLKNIFGIKKFLKYMRHLHQLVSNWISYYVLLLKAYLWNFYDKSSFLSI